MISRFALSLLCGAFVCSAAVPTFAIEEGDARTVAWTKIFASVGVATAPKERASILILPPGQGERLDALAAEHIVIAEGSTFPQNGTAISVRHMVDEHAPAFPILWQQPVDIVPSALPPDFHVYATERWSGAPLLAGKRTGHGAILWLATAPGESGYERYPYLLQALVDLGFTPPAQAANLWAFFDGPYRSRADLDYLARRWRAAGISVLHVAAWHNMEDDATSDAFMKKLIEACHRNAILVYAWLELPHVSEKFWAEHPEWREKTAVGQDAQLDWRKLMNLQNPACHEAVANEVRRLLDRFDWDGVNLAELYFESLEGAANPSRFTPMNDDVRAEFKALSGTDPKQLFDATAPATQGGTLKQFLAFRAVLAARLQSDWLKEVDAERAAKPYLDVVLTHIDDRFDPAIRDELGADVSRTLPSMTKRRSTLLVEDPANLWNLGPERYAKLAAKYQELTPDLRNVGVDINVVDRYQDVYPTKKQTGVELFELVHQAAASFGQVALYFENSIEKQDLQLLPFSASTAHVSAAKDGLAVTATAPTRVAWQGPATVDGKPWPVQDKAFVLVPAGTHTIGSAAKLSAPAALVDLNAEVRFAITNNNATEISYLAKSRAIAVVSSTVISVDLDGSPYWKTAEHAGDTSVLLPSGQHVMTLNR